MDPHRNKKINTSYYCRDSFIEDKTQIPGPGYYSKELIDEKKDTLYYKDSEKQKIQQTKKRRQNNLTAFQFLNFSLSTCYLIQRTLSDTSS